VCVCSYSADPVSGGRRGRGGVRGRGGRGPGWSASEHSDVGGWRETMSADRAGGSSRGPLRGRPPMSRGTGGQYGGSGGPGWGSRSSRGRRHQCKPVLLLACVVIGLMVI